MIHKNTDPSHSSNTKPISGKVKFATPSSGPSTLKPSTPKDKQVNVVQTAENVHYEESDNEESETTLPEETSDSSKVSPKMKYFDLLSSSSKEYDSSNNSDNDE